MRGEEESSEKGGVREGEGEEDGDEEKWYLSQPGPTLIGSDGEGGGDVGGDALPLFILSDSVVDQLIGTYVPFFFFSPAIPPDLSCRYHQTVIHHVNLANHSQSVHTSMC